MNNNNTNISDKSALRVYTTMINNNNTNNNNNKTNFFIINNFFFNIINIFFICSFCIIHCKLIYIQYKKWRFAKMKIRFAHDSFIRSWFILLYWIKRFKQWNNLGGTILILGNKFNINKQIKSWGNKFNFVKRIFVCVNSIIDRVKKIYLETASDIQQRISSRTMYKIWGRLHFIL